MDNLEKVKNLKTNEKTLGLEIYTYYIHYILKLKPNFYYHKHKCVQTYFP